MRVPTPDKEQAVCCRCRAPIERSIGGHWRAVYSKDRAGCRRRQQGVGGVHRLVPALLLPDDIELWLADKLAPEAGRYPFVVAA